MKPAKVRGLGQLAPGVLGIPGITRKRGRVRVELVHGVAMSQLLLRLGQLVFYRVML